MQLIWKESPGNLNFQGPPVFSESVQTGVIMVGGMEFLNSTVAMLCCFVSVCRVSPWWGDYALRFFGGFLGFF